MCIAVIIVDKGELEKLRQADAEKDARCARLMTEIASARSDAVAAQV